MLNTHSHGRPPGQRVSATTAEARVLYATALRELQAFLKATKKSVNVTDFDPDRVARTDVRIGHIDGVAVRRFVIHFRSTGCLWDKRAGGCTMCGFWNETAQFKSTITHRNFVSQFVEVLQTHNLQEYPVLSLYNAGSFLAEQEIPFSAVEDILSLIARRLPALRRVIIESRIEHASRDKLRRLQRILGSRTQLALAVGFESQDDVVRNLCVHKGCTPSQFERCIEIANTEGIHSIVYLILKPPFLTEREALEEAVASTWYVSRTGASEINYETMTVESGTLVSLMHAHGHYALPWLWSVAEILRQVRPVATPFLTPFRYISESVATPRNCALCTPSMIESIYDRYCSDFAISHLDHVDCRCQEQWKQELARLDNRPIPERVLHTLQCLRRQVGATSGAGIATTSRTSA